MSSGSSFTRSSWGIGKRFFDDMSGRVPLKLVGLRTFSTGVLYLTYVPSDL